MAKEGEQLRRVLVSLAKGRERGDRNKFEVFEPVGRSTRWDLTESVAGTRWVLTSKTEEGSKNVKARLAANGYQTPALMDG